jgi:WD40 repeat protein
MKEYSSPLSKDCGKILESFDLETDAIDSIQVDENTNTLISGSQDGIIEIWDLEDGTRLKTLRDHDSSVSSVLIVPNNKFISGSIGEVIKIWDLKSHRCLHTIINYLEVHSLCLISEDEIACGCDYGSFIVWNLNSLKKVRSIRVNDISTVTNLFLFDKTKLIVCNHEGFKIQIWDLQTFKCIKQLKSYFNGYYLTQLTINQDLLTFSGNEIKLVQIETGDLLKSIKFDHSIFHVKSLNVDLIAAALENGDVQIYDLCDMEMVKSIQTDSKGASDICLLSNGKLLSASTNGDTQLIEIFEQK